MSSSLLDRVKRIIDLKEYQTIDSEGNIQDISSWGTTFKRYLYEESHITTCEYLESLTDELIASIRIGMHVEALYNFIPEFIIGIETYIHTTSTKPYSAYVANRLCISIGRLRGLEKKIQEEYEKEETQNEEPIVKPPPTEEDLVREKRHAINILRHEILELTLEREYVLREKNRLNIILKRKIRKNMKKYD